MRFSERTGWDLSALASEDAMEPNPATCIDLASSNLTAQGLREPAHALLALQRVDASSYEPDPLGEAAARAAVAADYERRGILIAPNRIAITASTSEAYAYLFKLLCDPGDEVLVPQPSYPLFAYLAGLESVNLVDYRLAAEEGFRVDIADVQRRIGAKTRAIIVVHPNNPTGSYVAQDDQAALLSVCHDRNIALIADEVFYDYTLAPSPPPSSFAAHDSSALSFTLSGLSKVLALPQLKLGWIGVRGPEKLVNESMMRLSVVMDTYLSVATPVQRCLGELLAARAPIQAELLQRVKDNLSVLDEQLLCVAELGVRRRPIPAGFTALIELPRVHSDQVWTEQLRRSGVLVQPGHFYEMEDSATLVLTLIAEPVRFSEGVRRMVAALRAELEPRDG